MDDWMSVGGGESPDFTCGKIKQAVVHYVLFGCQFIVDT